jgi:hypothetical protein
MIKLYESQLNRHNFFQPVIPEPLPGCPVLTQKHGYLALLYAKNDKFCEEKRYRAEGQGLWSSPAEMGPRK